MLWAVLRLYPGRLRSWSLEPKAAFPGVLKISKETGREAWECVRLGCERAAGRVKNDPLSSSDTSSRPGVFYMSQREGGELEDLPLTKTSEMIPCLEGETHAPSTLLMVMLITWVVLRRRAEEVGGLRAESRASSAREVMLPSSLRSVLVLVSTHTHYVSVSLRGGSRAITRVAYGPSERRTDLFCWREFMGVK